ncbi:hypothetical protein [Halomonas garicola]|uniref:hypothetical protein n=1 Tax=Halomonas garicola TaxID=1690008 RepID=UPI002899D766|nr:hypothetical protein [Halomonas garicola]
MQDLALLTDDQLLRLYASVLRVLKNRGVTRSTNNPVADYAEKLVAEGLNLDLVTKSNAGFDALDSASGARYEVKARRLTPENGSTQLSAIRNLDSAPFDFLVGVIFNEDFSLAYAAMLPLRAVEELAVGSRMITSPIGVILC